MSENMKAWSRECKNGDEVQAWFRKMADQFRQEGATHYRICGLMVAQRRWTGALSTPETVEFEARKRRSALKELEG